MIVSQKKDTKQNTRSGMSKLFFSYLFKTNLAAFRSAIIADDTDKICRLLDIEHDFLHKHIDGQGNTALLLAIEHASPLTIRLLLEQGAQPDLSNDLTLQTPLGLIASKFDEDYQSYKSQKKLEMAKFLLDHGAYINKPSLRHYRDENNRDYSAKETPLITAARKNNLPLTSLLIERKADVNYAERQSQIRAIHYAIVNGNEEMFDLLTNAGALCPSILSQGDENLLHWFCSRKENDQQISFLKKLIDKGCELNKQNCKHRTPLMLAASEDMIQTCQILLENDANALKRDCHGHQAIDFAVQNSECAKLLQQTLDTHKHQLQIENSPANKTSSTILWRQRIDLPRISTTSSIEMNNKDETNSQVKYSDNEEEKQQEMKSPAYLIVPFTRKKSADEKDKKGERLLEKLREKRKVTRKLSKARKASTEIVEQLWL